MSLNWQPSATFATLRLRAKFLEKIRCFFTTRNVLEVETPLLSHATVTSPHLHSFASHYDDDCHQSMTTLYLQTSPEYAMKRLLAAGSGPIFQLGKAFRNGGEKGRLHNPEFTLLEWYQPGFDHHALMDEMDDFLKCLLNTPTATRYSYAAIFEHYLAIDPHLSTAQELAALAKQHNIHTSVQFDNAQKDDWLNLLMSQLIEPNLGETAPVFIYDFPASQAALAKIPTDNPTVAERFEVYFKGTELANGFHELTDVEEQRQRFTQEAALRAELNYPAVPIDEYFLSALQYGLPSCAGVAVGIDRLFMLALDKRDIAEVLSFTIATA